MDDNGVRGLKTDENSTTMVCSQNHHHQQPAKSTGRLSKPKPKPKPKPTFKKVQVVYYLCKNGQLEHPHFMEITHLAHHHLLLKDVLDRLSVLRGRAMPSLYSWSCKRSYKNGYVWNDLGENDIISPSEGDDEYVLKGSEILHPSTPTDKIQQPQNHMQTAAIVLPKRNPRTPTRHLEFQEDEELEYEEKRISYTNTPSRCSRGVSTEEIKRSTELTPPPSLSTTSGESLPTSARFEDGEPDPPMSRTSLLLNLIACGGSVGFKGKSDQPAAAAAGRKSSSSGSSSFSSLHRGVLCKVAAARKAVAVAVEDEICCMSENPRFGNLQSEEKEYFSGSIVESMTEEKVQVEPILKKSNSYNEESSKATMSMGEAEAVAGAGAGEEEEMKREKALIGKCIPRKKTCSKPAKN